MISFKTTIQKFGEMGEKTGWTYIEIPAELAEKLCKEKTSFRVKGKLDNHVIKQIGLWPMGEGNFILPLNAEIRRALGKKKGYELAVKLELDSSAIEPSSDLIQCLNDEPKALENFNRLPKSERNYFSKWIDSAKTEATRAKRIAQTVNAMVRGYRYNQMVRALKAEKGI